MSRPIADLYGADAAEDPLIAEFDGARQLTLGGEWREGLAKLEALAHRGSILSMLFVAGAMLEGWGYDQDLPGAGAWYDVAAQSGFTAGLFGLALTEIRMGCPRKAVQKLEAAISKNYPPAYNALAYLYSQGEGVSANKPCLEPLAKRLFARSPSGQTFAGMGSFEWLRRLSWPHRGLTFHTSGCIRVGQGKTRRFCLDVRQPQQRPLTTHSRRSQRPLIGHRRRIALGSTPLEGRTSP